MSGLSSGLVELGPSPRVLKCCVRRIGLCSRQYLHHPSVAQRTITSGHHFTQTATAFPPPLTYAYSPALSLPITKQLCNDRVQVTIEEVRRDKGPFPLEISRRQHLSRLGGDGFPFRPDKRDVIDRRRRTPPTACEVGFMLIVSCWRNIRSHKGVVAPFSPSIVRAQSTKNRVELLSICTFIVTPRGLHAARCMDICRCSDIFSEASIMRAAFRFFYNGCVMPISFYNNLDGAVASAQLIYEMLSC